MLSSPRTLNFNFFYRVPPERRAPISPRDKQWANASLERSADTALDSLVSVFGRGRLILHWTPW